MHVLAPARTAVAYYRVDEEQERRDAQASQFGRPEEDQQRQRREDEERARLAAEAQARRAQEEARARPQRVQLVSPEEGNVL